MKKCIKCKITFHFDDRVRCLYCNALLMQAERDDTLDVEDILAKDGFDSEKFILKQIIRDRKLNAYGRKEFIVGSYFRTRKFHFLYFFSRHEFMIGRKFKRLLVQPLDMSWFLKLPWIAVDLVDTLFIRLFYNSYCEKCNWKFPGFGSKHHDKVSCEYSKEYSFVIEDILSGKIVKNEKEYADNAKIKIAAKKKSAYHDLCKEQYAFSGVIDFFCVWISVCIFIFIIVKFISPVLSSASQMIDSFGQGMHLR